MEDRLKLQVGIIGDVELRRHLNFEISAVANRLFKHSEFGGAEHNLNHAVMEAVYKHEFPEGIISGTGDVITKAEIRCDLMRRIRLRLLAAMKEAKAKISRLIKGCSETDWFAVSDLAKQNGQRLALKQMIDESLDTEGYKFPEI